MTNIRAVGFETLYTGLPIQPMDMGLPLPGEVYPSGRAIGRGRSTPTIPLNWASLSSRYFWTHYPGLASKAATFNTSYVDWASITRTYQRPRNACGGIPRYTVNLGTATAPDGITTQALYEERQPLLVPPNTYTEARKLAPADTDAAQTAYFKDPTQFDYVPYIAVRWWGGSVSALGNGGGMGVTFNAEGTGSTVGLYCTPIDPVTLAPGATTLIASLTEIGGGPTLIMIKSEDIASAGGVPFDQFWLSTDFLDVDWYVVFSFLPPDNIPAPYDLASSFSPSIVTPGGFYS